LQPIPYSPKTWALVPIELAINASSFAVAEASTTLPPS
jgi:hypothetical protein